MSGRACFDAHGGCALPEAAYARDLAPTGIFEKLST